MRILLLEPDKVLARTMCAALELAGHTASWQMEAEAAIHALDDAPAEVIILELQLAAHGGVEFLHELRSYPEWEHIPVIIHTILPRAAPAANAQAWQQLGVADYLYKPHTTLAHLVQTVDRVGATARR
jgi:DNA-binding response OmpR family regulator